MVNPQTVWQAALGELQMQMTKATFDTWVKPTHAIAYEDGTFIIGVQNGYAKDWLENRLMGVIKRTLTGIVNRSVEVRFVVQAQPLRPMQPPPALELHAPNGEERKGEITFETPSDFDHSSRFALNGRYTFDRFIVGSSNRLAYAACLAVAENPTHTYNPLFIYGGVGLGKTHLLQAIGNYAQEHHRRVLYVSSETFTNDLINAIRTRSTEAFRECYRSADYLLVDDIQFIAGKESTQEEFFHTFNALHSSGRQIVMSSDRPPQAITKLEERLASRFQWGLIADIQPPDLELRIAILRAKAEVQGAHLPNDVVYFIAGQMQNNIRELEGALNRILAHAQLSGETITLALAQRTLSNLVERKRRISIAEIIAAVSAHYGVSEKELLGPSRHKEVVVPRQMVMYLARQETGASLPEIGQALGGRDHTTILHGAQKIACEIERKDTLRRDVINIRERLYRER
ncbi:MAG: chromosomal replication initiator protein DnaA [Anaerolineae bacterium]